MSIITEEAKIHQKAVECAIKHNNNAFAARKYRTTRQQIRRWRARYDGTVQSLLPKSRKPLSHPNQHTQEELELIARKFKRFKHCAAAQVYRKCRDEGYKRSFGSMCKQLEKLKGYENTKVKKRYFKSNFTKLKAHYPGEFVEVDVKYVPLECIGFSSNYDRYYQITTIDLCSRKRVLSL